MGKPKILIIDDDQDLIEVMKTILEKKNYGIISASSGAEGLEKAKKEKPDMLILDVMMESVDTGFDVARKIRRDKTLAEVPILMLTAIHDKTGFDFSKEAGDETWLPVSVYMEKPIHPEQLLEKVKELLGG